MVTLSHGGYMKAQPVAEYRAQKRGGRGKQATATKEDDFVERLFIANTHDYHPVLLQPRPRLLAQGLRRAAGQPRSARGKPIVNLLPLDDNEKITAILPVKEFADEPLRVHGDRDGHGEEDAARRFLASAPVAASSPSTSTRATR